MRLRQGRGAAAGRSRGPGIGGAYGWSKAAAAQSFVLPVQGLLGGFAASLLRRSLVRSRSSSASVRAAASRRSAWPCYPGTSTGTGPGTGTSPSTSTGPGTSTDPESTTDVDTGTTGGQCGDGVLDVGEDCDDANLDDGDGCSATCEFEGSGGCGPGTVNVLQNEGFETGTLPPWITDAPNTTEVVDFAHAGKWAAQTTGGDNIEQDFAAVPVSALTSASFWSWHDISDNPILYAEWGYADNTSSGLLFLGDQLDGWQQHELLGNLSKAKSLTWLRIYGYSGGGPAADISRYDDFLLCRKP